MFSRRGLIATKINDIAKEAGLSHGLVYHYFNSKDEILTTLIERALEGSKYVVHLASQQNLSPIDQLHWLMKTILTGLSNDGAYLFLLTVQAFTSDTVPEQVKEMLTSKSTSTFEGILPIILAGQQAVQIVKEDPTKLSSSYFAMIQCISLQQVQQIDQLTPSDADLILKIFKP
ncbi:TetR/AcrR family transcriptional regulator [Planococcus kocurii]|uniref:TetR/AcrR family transcriptional regulator n=1 Tax=Planococcus TaxID=1372 RepID=UPI00165DEE88